MSGPSMSTTDLPADHPPLRRTLEAAGVPVAGRFAAKAGWVSRAWIGEDYVVRLSDRRFRDAYDHEAKVVDLLAGSDVPHARHVAHGDGPDGPWSVSERLRGRTLHDAWPESDPATRQSMIESLGAALRALHSVSVPVDLLPPWLAHALAGGAWPAYHPPVVTAVLGQVEAAQLLAGRDSLLLTDVAEWTRQRLDLFATDEFVLVHGDLHGSNVLVDRGRVTGLIDFAEALAQPADAELDTILRWCARAREFAATPDGRALDEASLAAVPGWLRGSYPELFARERLRERLRFYDMYVELAIYAHHPRSDVRDIARERIIRLVSGHDHLDGLVW